MSLHFIIDGYNLIKQTPVLDKINLNDSREALVRFLKIHRPQGNNPVTIVFDGSTRFTVNPEHGRRIDGKEGGFYSPQPASPAGSPARVIFSQNQSADDKIKRLVENSNNPKNIVVVTNDREIRDFSRQFQAQIKTVEEFLGKFNPSAKKRVSPEKELLSPGVEAEITGEMKKLWLKK